MKKILCCLLVTFFLFAYPAFAHKADEPSFLHIAGKDTNVYPVYGSTTDKLPIPNDIAAEVFLVNTPVTFELEEEHIPVPDELKARTKYSWTLGDGTVAEGLDVSHLYTKIGSYIVSVYASLPDKTNEKPVLLQSTLLHIVPNLDYKLPQARIAVNNNQIKDPLTDILRLPLTQPVEFNAGKSNAAHKIVSYEWDFGDKTYKKTTSPKISYIYDLKKYEYGLPMAFAVVRIKDENGFIADTYAQINNIATRDEASAALPKQKTSLFIYALLLGMLIIVPVIFITVKKKKSR